MNSKNSEILMQVRGHTHLIIFDRH